LKIEYSTKHRALKALSASVLGARFCIKIKDFDKIGNCSFVQLPRPFYPKIRRIFGNKMERPLFLRKREKEGAQFV